MKRVRVNSIYRYEPVWMDKHVSALYMPVVEGTLVRVVNMHGCPKTNTMGQCYIQTVDTKEFIGMVCTGSLVKP